MAQGLQSPEAFLGYKLGDAFTYHHRMVSYFEHVDQASDKVKLLDYGTTPERRRLVVAFVSAPENLAKLEEYRQRNLRLAGLIDGDASGKALPFVWLSYNIHGNESVSMEAAIKLLHTLASGQDKSMEEWLKEVIVVIDPCENPDGRDRYANWYNQTVTAHRNPDPASWEHSEPWPGGRFNHYLFDLNRDWAWQTQPESQVRTKLYQQYMPHIHVDLHEMGINEPYFFGPSAEPFHKSITPWQREVHKLSGINHAKYFDEQGWLYFTRETFDLFYPSYGDTWPTFNGAIGFTYEQGGSGRAGLSVLTRDGDTLTLKDRIDHHYASSVSTIELGYQHRERLVKEFTQFFKKGLTEPTGKYKSYVVKKAGNSEKSVAALLQLLDKQQIKYSHVKSAKKASFEGFEYLKDKKGSFSLEEGDVLISAYQPHHNMLHVLFDPKPELSDSLTYDMTAWALPYIYGVSTFASEAKIEAETAVAPVKQVKNSLKRSYAYAIAWEDAQDVRVLSHLLREGFRVRFAEEAFVAKGLPFEAGTLLVLRGDNRNMPGFEEKLATILDQHGEEAVALSTGLVDTGRDFGSDAIKMIQAPKVAVIGGDGVSPTAFGEMWFFFEKQLGYPASFIQMKDLGYVNLSQYQVIIMPDGRYREHEKKLLEFVNQGGKLIVLDGALRTFEKSEPLLMKQVLQQAADANKPAAPKSEELLKKYGDRVRESISHSAEGGIFKVHLDKTHPLAFGIKHDLFLPKRNSNIYPYLPEGGWNVGMYRNDSHIAGFVGSKIKDKIKESLAMGVEEYGRGQLIYMPDSPVFRAFWHSGLLVMGNAVFFVGQ
jgi:hypothetical protein